MYIDRKRQQIDDENSEVFKQRKKHEINENNVSELEWNAFKVITKHCIHTSEEMALDFLTLVKNKHISSLNLSNQGLKTLSPVIGKFIFLKKLLLINNKLKSLPKEISALRNLKILYLDKNSLKRDISVIRSLQTLKQLSLGETNRFEIPSCIFNLRNLTHLWLNDNFISEIPKEIVRLEKIERLDLRNNTNLVPYDRNWTGIKLTNFIGKITSGI